MKDHIIHLDMLVTMGSLKFALYIPFLCLWGFVLTDETSSFVYPVNSLVFAIVGENMTLQCSYKDNSANTFHWYKQTQGEKPILLSNFYKHDKKVERTGKLNNHFSVNFTESNYHLIIAKLRISDSGIYYCTSSYVNAFNFENIYIVHVTSLHLTVPVEVHQSPSESVQSGGSVTLNCRVHNRTCDEEHAVYWFKKSGESEPELIYTHGGKKEQCERKNLTCFYNLSMRNLNTSKAGTYHCAVAACGQILFGNGTNLNIQNKVNSPILLLLVYFLTGALAFITILCALLALTLFKVYKRISSKHTDQTDPSCDMIERVQEENLQYAALRNQKANKSRRKRETNEKECVYSSVAH
ncbi:uncharacterized protein [Takifugu rubripes]|uniref:Uncharacterized LOC101063762 n=1 Tax=Takifugu rubripes TaxID=31033 RepID=H2SQ09_TAKRU|nr:uncharacterized protein LOC101063762 [Takifugu rubripes]